MCVQIKIKPIYESEIHSSTSGAELLGQREQIVMPSLYTLECVIHQKFGDLLHQYQSACHNGQDGMQRRLNTRSVSNINLLINKEKRNKTNLLKTNCAFGESEQKAMKKCIGFNVSVFSR